MTKASAALVPLKGISFTWALGHTPHSSFTTWAEAEDAILEIIAPATETGYGRRYARFAKTVESAAATVVKR